MSLVANGDPAECVMNDPKYEFRAPKYVDFLGQEDPHADRFFGTPISRQVTWRRHQSMFAECRISLDKTTEFDDPMDAFAKHELQPQFDFVSPRQKGGSRKRSIRDHAPKIRGAPTMVRRYNACKGRIQAEDSSADSEDARRLGKKEVDARHECHRH